VKPEEALEAARAAAAAARARGAYDDPLEGFAIEPTDRVSTEMLMEWAVIEPDEALMRSTRRLGAPITAIKRLFLRALQQQFNELTSQQTRFNLHVIVRIAEIEERVARLEEVSGEGPPDPQRSGTA
jgi:hypothetical protein